MLGLCTRNSVKPSGPYFSLQAKRTAVNLKAVQERMKSVSSIRKITKAMKMVSAAKMKGDERRVKQAAAFTSPIAHFFDQFPRPNGNPANVGVIVVGSDKGLCGGVNGAVAREAKKFFGEMDSQNIKTHVIGVGQKASASLRMMHSHRFTTCFDEVSKIPINFLTASAIAHHVTQQAFDSVALISNTYVSIVSFNTQNQSILTGPSIDKLEPLSMSQAIDRYSLEPSLGECAKDLQEFYLANVLFKAMLESALVEQCTRMNAMENASKNAGSMFDSLSLVYNRARQAKITTELCEIISGASAV